MSRQIVFARSRGATWLWAGDQFLLMPRKMSSQIVFGRSRGATSLWAGLLLCAAVMGLFA
jgi:hypothetical protein